MRVLIVEDEPNLQRQLRDKLAGEGYAVDCAGDGREGLYLGQETAYDLAIIDIGLPEISGIELIKTLRREEHNYPILVLTARGEWQDKVEGLEAGADDYLTKPFHMEELLARMNALLRRAGGRASPIMDFGPLLLDTAAKKATCNGDEVNLTAFEYSMLEYLAHRAGKVVSKTELTEHLYDQDFDRDSNVIEVFVGRLRRKLDPQGQLKPIATLRGAGYRFELKPGVTVD